MTTPTFGSIAYGDAGRGSDALFIHGVLLNADLWDPKWRPWQTADIASPSTFSPTDKAPVRPGT